jgi:hypothetical protein
VTYYLLLDGDSEKDAYFDSNIIGEESFGKFYPERGFFGLLNMTEHKSELLERVVIKNETGEILTIEQFLDKVESLKIQKSA